MALLRERIELPSEDGAGRFGDEFAAVAHEVAQHHRRAGLPRQEAERVEVGTEPEVAEAGGPARELEAVERVHVQVDREQVAASVRAVLHDRVEEEVGAEALAHEPSERVRGSDEDGVNGAGANEASELGELHRECERSHEPVRRRTCLDWASS